MRMEVAHVHSFLPILCKRMSDNNLTNTNTPITVLVQINDWHYPYAHF